MNKILIILLRFYQLTFSQILPHSCRFYPTCSEYSIEAIKKYGMIKGILLGLKRILRCNPFFTGGYDPIPSKPRLRD